MTKISNIITTLCIERDTLITFAKGVLDMIRNREACNIITFSRIASQAKAAIRRISREIKRLILSQKQKNGAYISARPCEEPYLDFSSISPSVTTMPPDPTIVFHAAEMPAAPADSSYPIQNALVLSPAKKSTPDKFAIKYDPAVCTNVLMARIRMSLVFVFILISSHLIRMLIKYPTSADMMLAVTMSQFLRGLFFMSSTSHLSLLTSAPACSCFSPRDCTD